MNISILNQELGELRAKDLFREVRVLENVQGPYAQWNGKKILLFCGNDYLGLSRHPRVLAAVKKNVDQAGVGSGAARLISGTTEYHARLEEKLAAIKKKERALVFSAGYLANLGVLSALAGEGDLIVMDKLCHASLIDGAKLSGAGLRVFPHKNYGRCRKILDKGTEFRRRLLVSDTVFSMDGDLADLEELVRIKKQYDCMLVLDDAHATGVLGLTGGGAAEDLGLEPEIDVITGTFSKALGCLGGFAAASNTIIEYLINHARPFIFATSLPPVLCAAVHEALGVLEQEPGLRRKLWKNIQAMHEGLTSFGARPQASDAKGPGPSRPSVPDKIQSPIFPVMAGEEKEALRISAALLDQGILVPAIRTPTVPKGKARLRFTVSALHTPGDLEKLFSALDKIFL